MRWRPIKTAPKDGTKIRIKGYDFGRESEPIHEANVRWVESAVWGAGWQGVGGRRDIYSYATHWKPV